MTDDQFASYSDVYGPGGMADDRDDTYDPEFRQEQDYCPHGTYIGPPGGADILCGWCEDGISVRDMRLWQRAERTHAIRKRAENAALVLAKLLATGRIGGIDAAEFAQDSVTYRGNPRNRYGRH